MCLSLRLEVSLQQNEIMDLFVDDYKSLSDRDWITGNQSDATLKVGLYLYSHPSLGHTPAVTEMVMPLMRDML